MVELLARLGRTVPGFAWPEELVTHPATDKTLGFTLPFVPGKSLEAALDARETDGWSEKTKLAVALDVAAAVMNAHALTGPVLVLGDVIKPGNIQVYGRRAAFIDTASVNVFGFRTIDGSLAHHASELSSEGYVPPEVLGNPAALPSHASDLFALAVTLFQVLYGWHPCEPRPSPATVGLDLDSAVKDGLFLNWVRHPDFEPPTYDPVKAPREVDGLFRSAFLGRPDQRPPADAWVKALKRWRRSLRPKPPEPPAPPPPRRSWRPALRAGDALLTATAVLAATLMLGRWYATERHRVAEWLGPKPPEPLPAKPVGNEVFREVYR